MVKTKLENVKFYQSELSKLNVMDDVLSGLSRSPKMISPKYFYDQKGSALFDQICELPEYYVTRTEQTLLEDISQELLAHLPSPCNLYELGSGSSQKIRILLEHIRPKAYIPIDISAEHLLESALSLGEAYPWLAIHAACVDYSNAWSLPLSLPTADKVAFFPGSSIGNFEPSKARLLLQQIGQLVGNNGYLLIGVDLRKEASLLNAAYNDNQGITAAFNRNCLAHLNELLDCDFKVEQFTHKALFNEQESRVEMHLISTEAQTVTIGTQTVSFKQGENIHTESSYKYSPDSFIALAQSANFSSVDYWADANSLFSIHLLKNQGPD